MTFIREIPEAKVTDNLVLELEQFGFTLVYTGDSIEVWAEGSANREN